MKVIAVVTSPRKGGNCEIMATHTLKAIAEEGVDTELIRLAGLDIRPCNACMACKKEEICSIKDDFFPVYEKMKAADGIVVAAPVYYGSAPAVTKALIERAGYLARHNGRPFNHKVGGPLVVARRAGHNFTFAQLLMWFLISGFVVPGSTYWGVGFGLEKGEVTKDEEGMSTAWNFGKDFAWVLKKLKA